MTSTVYGKKIDNEKRIRFTERFVRIFIRKNMIQKSFLLNLQNIKTSPSNMRVRKRA
jgi:hypothetical protein